MLPVIVLPSLIWNQVKVVTGGLAVLLQVRITQLPTNTRSAGLMEAKVSLGETGGEGFIYNVSGYGILNSLIKTTLLQSSVKT
jgi:hypothetical protein